MKPVPAVPAMYDGREQAFVKHSLLKSYLEALVMIIGLSSGTKHGREVEICFADCFAGPWQAPSDDLSGTSIALSLQILAECKARLAMHGVTTKMRALFVEKDGQAFKRLDAFLQRQSGGSVEASCMQGDFLDLRQPILDWCGPNSFSFFFIDPKGFKEIGVSQLAPLLKRRRSEFLINFMYMFVNRAASIEELRPVMLQLLGKEVNLDGLSPDEREAQILGLYRAGLVAEMQAATGPDFPPRSAYARILDVLKERVKYHLVYLSSHPKGIVEFMKASESAEQVQQTVREHARFEAREQAAQIVDLFSDHERPAPTAARAAGAQIDQFWLEHLAGGPLAIGLGDFATILEKTDFFPGALQASLKGLIAQGLVSNDQAKRQRGSRPLHYEDSETLRLTPTGQATLKRV